MELISLFRCMENSKMWIITTDKLLIITTDKHCDLKKIVAQIHLKLEALAKN